jgi:OFA family oxalate/formate antiporter-like MFS transporter
VLLASAALSARNEPLFLATYGALFGLGAGMGFAGPIHILIEWMPENKGLASGIVTAGFGAGTLMFARIFLAVAATNPVTLPGVGVVEVRDEMPSFFVKFGLVYAVMQISGLAVLKPPPGHHASAAGVFSAPTKMALRTRETWVMLFLLAAQTSGIAIISNYQRDILVWNGASKGLLAWVVPIGGLGNTLGRIIFGQVENMAGFRYALMLNAALLAALYGTLSIVENAAMMVLTIFCLWNCLGGNFPLFVANTAKTFGPQFFAMNYAIVFLGFGGSGLIIGMSVKSWLPLLADTPSEAVRTVSRILSAQAVVVCVALATGIVRPPAQVQKELKERLDASLLELEAK